MLRCPPSPVIECLAGPIRERIPREEIPDPIRLTSEQQATSDKRYVPVVIMMEEKEAEQALLGGRSNAGMDPSTARQVALQSARKAYYLTLEELGMSGEYTDFPDIGESEGGFDPRVGE
jgi:hypothetical protein